MEAIAEDHCMLLEGADNYDATQDAEPCVRFGADKRIHTRMISGSYCLEDGRAYVSFGIRVENGFGVIRDIPDISTDARKVEILVEKMNRNRVSRYHIDDIVQDFLAEL